MRRYRWGVFLLTLAAQAAAAEPATSGGSDAAATAGSVVSAGSTPATAGGSATASSAAPADDGSSWSSPADWAIFRGLGVESWMDVFRFGTWQATVDLSGDGNLQKTQSPGTPDATFSSRLTTEGVSFRNQGFALVDPRLLTGDVGVHLAIQQGAQDSGESSTAQNIDVTDWFVDATLLQEMPYNLAYAAGHTEVVTSLVGGGSTASKGDSQLATFTWREDTFLREKEIMPYFSATAQAGRQHLQAVTRVAGQTFRQDEQRSFLRLDGHNSFLNGDLYFDLENSDLQNYEYPAGSFRSRYGNVNYDMDFGPNLDRHSTTILNYNERSGDFDFSYLNLNENLDIDHSDFLSSYYDYSLVQTDSPFGSSTSNFGSAGVEYSPYLNLSTNINGIAGRDTFDSGYIQTVGGSGGASYYHALPASGQLSTSLNGSLNYNESHLQSARIPAIDQPYAAPPELGAGAGFVLRDSNVVTDSIIVVDVRGGSRVLTEEGVDYDVIVEGSQTTIVPLPTSAVIQPGDPLQVSYFHLVDPSVESKTITRSGYVLMDWNWIAVSYTHDETRQVPLSGQQTLLLSDLDRDTLRLELRGDWGAVQAWGYGSAMRYRATDLDYDQENLVGNVSYRPSYTWLFLLNSTLSDTKYLTTGRESKQKAVRLDISWNSPTGWWANGFVSYRTLDDTDMPYETVADAVVQVRRNWTKLDFLASVGVGERTRGDVQTRYGNIHLAVVRQF